MKKFDIKNIFGGLLGNGGSGKGLYSDSGGYPDGTGGMPQNDGYGGGYDNYSPQQQSGYNSYSPQQGVYNNYPPQQGGYNSYPPQQGGYNNYPQQQGGYDNYPPQQGGYDNYPQQQGEYNNYPPQQSGYNNYPPQQSGYDSYPSPQQGGYDNYPRQQSGYNNYPPQQGGYNNYPAQQQGGYGALDGQNDSWELTDDFSAAAPRGGKAGSGAPKKNIDIGGIVTGLTGGIKSSVDKIKSKLSKPQKLYSDEDIVPDASSRTSELSDIQAAEIGAVTAMPQKRQLGPDPLSDDSFTQSFPASSEPSGFAEAPSAAPSAAARGRFRRASGGSADIPGAADMPAGPETADVPMYPRTAVSSDIRAASRSRTGESSLGTAYEREAAAERGAETSERLNYKFTPDVVYDQHRDDIGYVPPLSAAPHNHLRYKRRNRRPMKMWLKASLTVLCCVLFFTTAISLFFVNMMTSRINYVGKSVHNTVYLSIDEKRALSQEETSIEENENEFTVPTITDRTDKDVKLILLIASDEPFASGRSCNCDSLLLVVIDKRYKQIKLVSIMSELYVRIPGYYSNKLGKAFYYDTAKGDYSLSILRQTIYDNFRLTIDNYVVVDYKALETLVNRLGGVPMELTVQEAEYMRSDPKYGLFPRYTYGGHYNMSGAETLNYVRMKKVGDGSFERTLRQRKVFYELLDKLGDLSFIELSELTYAMLPLLGTDMSKSEVNYYFKNARSISEYQIDQLRIPIEGSFRFGEANVLGNKFEVLVTNYVFTSEALRDYIYDNDSTYQGGAYAEDVVLPDVAPLPEMLEEQEGQ